jgi:hypothetical protein
MMNGVWGKKRKELIWKRVQLFSENY